MSRTTRSRRQGIAILIVMVLVILISLGVYSFAQLMTAQHSGTVMAARRAQARAAAASGVEYIKDYLSLAPAERDEGGHWDNPSYFQDIPVGGADDSLRFSVVSITTDLYGEPSGIRFGLTDEGSKLNINFLVSEAYSEKAEEAQNQTSAPSDLGQDGSLDSGQDSLDGGAGGDSEVPDAGADMGADAGEDLDVAEGEDDEEEITFARDALLMLPGMTETIADSILDWIDSDDEPRTYGAEADAYAGLGYEPRNGPISHLDELLLIPEITPELLYGADRNHNGLLDDNEAAGAEALGGSASMARGWAAFLTTRSQDFAEQAEEELTVDLNQDDLETLYDELTAAGFTAEFAAYVVFYRQNGPYTFPEPEDPTELVELPEPQSISFEDLDFSKAAETEITSVLDLLGTMSQGTLANEEQQDSQQQTNNQQDGSQQDGNQQEETVVVQSPYMDASQLATVLPDMMYYLVAGELGGSNGVNLNHCSSAVAEGMPEIDPDVVQSILQYQDREGASGDPNYEFLTWPLGLGAVTIEQMKALMPYVAGQGTVFRAQVIGYSDVPGVYARVEVVIDTSGDQPQVVSWRDLSHLGLGFSIDDLTQ